MDQKERKNDFFSRTIDKTIDFIFSKDIRKWVLLTFILGFILRLLTSLRVEFFADEMLHVPLTIGFIESGKLQIMAQESIWFWLTDLFGQILGVNALGVRFFSVLTGSLSIILIFLLGKELFNKKVGLIASIIFAFSPFQIFHTMGEMDIPMSFFALVAMYLLILFYKNQKIKFFLFAWVSLGVAIMIKPIALWFIPAFTLFHLYYTYKKNTKADFRKIFLAAAIIILMVTPVLTHNYLLYKDKGLVDMQFARFTKIGFEKYADIGSTIQPFDLQTLLFSYNGGIPGFLVGLAYIYTFEVILVTLFAIIGLFYFCKSKNRFFWLLIFSFIFPFLFLAGTSLMSKHFLFEGFFVAPIAALGIVSVSNFFKNEKFKKLFIYTVLLVIISLSLITLQNRDNLNGFIGKNELTKMIDFKDQNIEEDSLVIVDSRIYRGRIAFMFWDRHYLESSYFPQILDDQDSLQGQIVNIPTYFIEAVQDDSGWGTIKDQPEFNQSTENIASFFKLNSPEVKIIGGINGEEHFAVYKVQLPLKSSTISIVDKTHNWYYYPLEYKPSSEVFDNYETYNTFDTLLDKFAHMVLYLDLLATLLIVAGFFYLFFRDD